MKLNKQNDQSAPRHINETHLKAIWAIQIQFISISLNHTRKYNRAILDAS